MEKKNKKRERLLSQGKFLSWCVGSTSYFFTQERHAKGQSGKIKSGKEEMGKRGRMGPCVCLAKLAEIEQGDQRGGRGGGLQVESGSPKTVRELCVESLRLLV